MKVLVSLLLAVFGATASAQQVSYERIVKAALAYAEQIGAWTCFDTFAGEGGAGEGYAQAGAIVVGVETNRNRRVKSARASHGNWSGLSRVA